MALTNPAGTAGAAAAAYIQALLDALGDRDPFHVQEGLVADLRTAIQGLSTDDLRRPEAPGKWSIVEVIQHLADTELVHAYRIRMILAHECPPIQGYDQDLWAERLGYRGADVEDALSQLQTLRGANLRLIRSLSPDQLDRFGIHAERGEESVRRILHLLAGHDRVHLAQIARIRAGLAISAEISGAS